MKKLNLKDVRIQELPNPPYSCGLLDAMKEVYDSINKAAKDTLAAVSIKSMTFDLTDGAEEYLHKNLSEVMEGHNKYVFLQYPSMEDRIKGMYIQDHQLVIGFY